MMSPEKRHARRFELALPVMLMPASKKKSPRTIQTRDISSTGVLLHCDEDVLPGTAMELVVTMPEHVTQATPVRLRCMGHVVRVHRGQRNRLGVAVKIDRYEFVRFQEKSPKATRKANLKATLLH